MQSQADTRAMGDARASLLKELSAAANFGHRWAKASAGAALAGAAVVGDHVGRDMRVA